MTVSSAGALSYQRSPDRYSFSVCRRSDSERFGFSCAQASGVVTCSGGTLQIGGTAHITINTNAPSVEGEYTNTATVDPNNTIAERKETNNTTSTFVPVYWVN